MGFTIDLLPSSADNYIFLVSDTEIGLSMVVDPGDADIVIETLQERDLHLALILNTHHHGDHTAGNLKLQKEYGAPIIGPSKESHRIEGLSRQVDDGDFITFSDMRGQVIETPGHTSGSISFYFPALKALFCGDTLFSIGCGRLFEGNATEMWESLLKLRTLPDDTQIYCGHEYTARNIPFALRVDPDNEALKKRVEEVNKLTQKNQPTIPTPLSLEKEINPFLRADIPEFQHMLEKNGFPTETAPAAIFGSLRAAKDKFKG